MIRACPPRLALLLVAALLAGCDRAPPPPPVDRPAADDPTMAALHRAWQQAHARRLANEALIASPAVEEEALAAIERRWTEARVAEGIPLEFDESALAAALVAHARAEGLTLVDVLLEPRPDQAPAFPPTIAPEAAYPVTAPLALRKASCELEFVVGDLAQARRKLQRFLAALAEAGPLLVPTRVKLAKGRASLFGECFAFRLFDPPPRYAVPALTAGALAKAEGIEALAAVKAGSAGGRALAQLETEVFQAEALRPLAEAVLGPRSRAALKRARLEAFEERRAAARAVTLEALERPPAIPRAPAAEK